MRSLLVVFALLLITGCGAGGYRQDASDRPQKASAGSAEMSTGPTADPDAYSAALPRAVVAHGRDWRGNVRPLGVLTGAVLVAALVLGVYTVLVTVRRPRAR